MTLLDYLLGRKKKTASVAKERLQIILAREHFDRDGPDFLVAMKKDILDVVGKYVAVDLDRIQVTLDKNGDTEILELNILLPDTHKPSGKVQVLR
ncbi:MAG: cell division topological specificity factor MinE [Gammaproteobacteria bacterium]|nr:cell division topological specificity factor MinE [Gammaproteobacteria bacterium]